MKQMLHIVVPVKTVVWSVVTVLAVGLSIATHASIAKAQSASRDSIALSPSVQRLSLKAGEVTTGKLTVINDGTSDENFIVYARPYSVKNEQYDPDFQTTASPNTDIYQWVQFDKTTYMLGAGKSIDIPYRLQVPIAAAPGGHYGIIFVETQPPLGTTDSVMRKKRVGSLLQTTIKGTGIQKGRFLSADANFWQVTPPLTVNSRVENTGNTDLQTNGILTIKDVFGKVKYTSTKDFTVYPGTIRKINMIWDTASWFGLFRVEQAMTVLGQTTTTSHMVLMAPRWLPIMLIVIALVWVIYAVWRHKRQ